MLAALKMLVDADQQTAFTVGAWEEEARLIIADVESDKADTYNVSRRLDSAEEQAALEQFRPLEGA